MSLKESLPVVVLNIVASKVHQKSGEVAVKGLIFNLLDSMARQSGCSDEAWDLVMEFVASETDHEADSDTCLSCFDQVESLWARSRLRPRP